MSSVCNALSFTLTGPLIVLLQLTRLRREQRADFGVLVCLSGLFIARSNICIRFKKV